VAGGRYLTSDLPGIGGVIKQRPTDFLVEEIPLYEPAGQGEHIYLFVEKRGLSTLQLVSILARHFGVGRHAVGYAGLKDKVAVTRQVISVHVPGKRPEDFPMLQDERVAVLWADLHHNKLRRGHLRGNRFSIRVRGVDAHRVLGASRVLERLRVSGVPNRVGEQRFGSVLNNHSVGRAMVLRRWDEAVRALLGPGPALAGEGADGAARALFASGDLQGALGAFPRWRTAEREVLRGLVRGLPPERAFALAGETERSFFLSAFQSAVFNRVLDARLDAGTLAALLEGDIACRHESRTFFDATREVLDAPDTPARLASGELSATGPMWGAAMRRASGAVDEAEVRALAEFGVTPADLVEFERACPRLLDGARRPLRAPVTDPEVEGGVDEHGHFVRCAFELPRGAFATVVMREVMKPAPGSEAGAGLAEDGGPAAEVTA
jgi:tRNA pseudouridine13 synthase